MSFDITSQTTTWGNRLFVEASAGTGKTFLIEHYVVRSILSGLRPQELALITFTRAASTEITSRLKNTLEQTHLAILGGDESFHDYLLPVIKQDELSRKQRARQIEDVLDRFHEATITTIHGFCDRLLELWDGEGVEEWLTEEEKRLWLMEYLHEQAELSPREWRAVGKFFGYDQERLLAYYAAQMETVQQSTEPSLSKALEGFRGVQHIAEALSIVATRYRGSTHRDGTLRREYAYYFRTIEELVTQGVTEKRLEALLSCDLASIFSSLLLRPPAVDAHFQALVDQILVELWPSIRWYVDPKCCVERLGCAINRDFVRYLFVSRKKTPNSVIQRVYELRTKRNFVEMATKQFQWLIVDEFQDTDHIQNAIFSSLFLDNASWNGHVLFVGDPKQAIYGFRNADVYSYLEAKRKLENDVRTLSANFRSEQSHVRAQNQLFCNTGLFYLPRLQTSLPVVENVGLHPGLPLGDDRGAIHCVTFSGSLGRKRRWPHEDLEETAIFPWIADEMIALADRGVRFRDQAILVKDKYQAKRIQEYLARRSIPTCTWRLESIAESPVIGWLQKAIALASKPYDMHRLTSLLLYFPVGEWQLELCNKLLRDPRKELWAAHTESWTCVQRAFLYAGVGGLARTVFLALHGDQDVEGFLRSYGKELISDLEHCFELLSRIEDQIPRTLESYMQALDHLNDYFSLDPDLLPRRVDPDDEGVPILTMHRSKGLEFDVVFALGAASRTPVQEDMEPDEADAEKIRQLYVAITRAKRRTYLPILLDVDEKTPARGTASGLELALALIDLHRGTEPCGDALYARITAPYMLQQLQKVHSEEITLSDGHCHRMPSVFQRAQEHSSASLPVVRGKNQVYRSFSSTRPSVHRPTGSCSSASFGIRFHDAIARALKGESVPEDLLISSTLEMALPIDGKNVFLKDIPPHQMRVETPFLNIEGETISRGVLDLVFVFDKAVYGLDWKTNCIPEGMTPEEFIRAEGYDEQYRIYRAAIEKAYSPPDFRFGGFFFVFVRHQSIVFLPTN